MLSHLYTVLLILVVAWSSWALFGAAAVIVSAIVFTLALFIAYRWSLVQLAVIVLCVLMLIILLLPAVCVECEASRRMQCANHLKQIGLALYNYHHTYKCFPPAYISDKNGKPMHSWRVLILPFMDEEHLYARYRFNEPWDGPHNIKLLGDRPKVYACLGDAIARTKNAALTNYVAVVGVNNAWCGERSRSVDAADLRGKADSTVMLVEVANTGIRWTEPKDLSVEAVHTVVASPPQTTVPSNHAARYDGFFYRDSPMAYAVLVNGSVRAVPAGLPATSILMSIGGCTEENLNGCWSIQINWPHCIGLSVWLASVSLLLHQAFRSRKPRQPTANSST